MIKLASIENRDSGYSLADYRRLLEKIYLDTRRDESYMLAKTINTELYQSLSQINPELENRGVKMAPFAVPRRHSDARRSSRGFLSVQRRRR